MSDRRTIFLPLHTKTRGNGRTHWRVDWKRTKSERETSCLMVKASKPPRFPVKVTLTRFGPRKLDRHNLPSALKAVIDGIADAYGVDDGDERWQFRFGQMIHKTYGVEVVLEAI